MKINTISAQSFGARPDQNTKYLLYQMEKNGVDTEPITDTINKIYVGDNLSTRILSDGRIRMDIYERTGDQKKSVIKKDDNVYVNSDTYKPKDAKKLADKIYKALTEASLSRTPNQLSLDKVNFNINEK